MGRLARLLPSTGHPLNPPDLITPTEVRRLLSTYGLAPRRADGQNFVVDPNTVRRIVATAGLHPDDRVLEIGPGLGSLTVALRQAVSRVVAVEIDAGFVRVLDDMFAGCDDVAIVHADAMAIDFDQLLGGEPARMVANLPYNLATPIVMRALDSTLVTDAYVMVQREVGQRWAAGPGDPLRAAVSVKMALEADVTIATTIPRTAFYPVPNVDSVMVRLTRRDDAPAGDERAQLRALVEAAFAQRRKTLRNNLADVAPAGRLAAAAATAGIDLSARAETIDTAAFRRLAAELAG